MVIKITDYKINARASTKTNLGIWNGAQLRSVLKNHAARVDCNNPKMGQCSTCTNRDCLSRKLFDNKSESEGTLLSNLCILDAGFRTEDFKSDEIEFTLKVLGDQDTRILQLFDKGLYIGMPKTEFKITNIEVHTTEMNVGCLNEKNENAPKKCKLTFVTPYVNKAKSELDLYKIGKSITSRVTSVINANGLGYKYDYNSVNQAINKLRVVSKDIRTTYYSKYSSRTKQLSRIRGYIGSMTLEGDFSQIYNSLKLAEALNIGKEVTMGFGKLQVEEVGD